MESFLIKNNSKVALMSQSNNRYIKGDTQCKLLVNSCHPFLLHGSMSNTLNSFVIIQPGQKDTEISFGAQIYLRCEDGSFLSSNPNGDVFLEKVSPSEFKDESLMKFRRWGLFSRNNSMSKKKVTILDEIVLRSFFGNYLRTEANSELFANTTVIEDRSTFFIHQESNLPLPDWTILRPLQSQLHLSAECLEYFRDFELFFAQSSQKGNRKTPIRFQSQDEAEKHILEETLYSFLACDGSFISRHFYENGKSFYSFDENSSFEINFVQMINRLLPLSGLHDRLRMYEELNGRPNKSLTLQAFSQALGDIRREFYIVVNSAEELLQKGELDCQKLWLMIQPSFRTFEQIDFMITKIENNPNQILSLLHSALQTAIDSESKLLYSFLLRTSVKQFATILGKWIYMGILDDLSKEFFVEEKIYAPWSEYLNTKLEENYWEAKYILKPELVPNFLENLSEKVFLTGKYVNVIKSYDTRRQYPGAQERLIAFESEFLGESLAESVSGAFDWANSQLINIVLKEEKILLRIRSIKRFFFMELGDYFIHFMDLAEDELKKSAKSISLEKLQNFLELALRSSSANTDPYKEDVQCSLTSYSTLEVLQAFTTYQGLRENKLSEIELNELPVKRKGYEVFAIDFTAHWPINLVLSKSTLLRYQVLFRFLFSLKYSERLLCQAWLAFQEKREMQGNKFFRLSLTLLQRMLHLNRTLFRYFVHDVVQSKWDEMINSMEKNVNRFEDILKLQSDFLQACFQNSLLLDKRFKNRIWEINQFFIYYSESMKDFLYSFFNLDYKSLIVNQLD